MTTSLDAYRSDREQLLARVHELEAEVEQLEDKLKKVDAEPFDWLRKCPVCGCTESGWGKEQATQKIEWRAANYPKACFGRHGFWNRLLRLSGHAHAHQRCTACGAHWVVDAEGWRFE